MCTVSPVTRQVRPALSFLISREPKQFKRSKTIALYIVHITELFFICRIRYLIKPCLKGSLYIVGSIHVSQMCMHSFALIQVTSCHFLGAAQRHLLATILNNVHKVSAICIITAALVTARDVACGKHWYARPKKINRIHTMLFFFTSTDWKGKGGFMTEDTAAYIILKEQYLTPKSLLLNDKEITLYKSLICVSQGALQIFSFIFFSPLHLKCYSPVLQ